jgi:hypothetical protein
MGVTGVLNFELRAEFYYSYLWPRKNAKNSKKDETTKYAKDTKNGKNRVFSFKFSVFSEQSECGDGRENRVEACRTT